MSFLKKKVTALMCPNDDCNIEVQIRCGSCRQEIPFKRYESGPKRFVCLCGHECTLLTCPKCGRAEDPYEFTVARELSRLEPDMREFSVRANGNS